MRRRFPFRAALSAIAASGAAIIPRPATTAELINEKFLTIEITGELTPEVRAALNRVIDPSTLESAIAEGADGARPLFQICTENDCSSKRLEQIKDLWSGSVPDQLNRRLDQEIAKSLGNSGWSGVRLPSVVVPNELDSGAPKTYVILNRDNPLYEAYGVSGPFDTVGVPVPTEVLKDAIEAGEAFQAIAPAGSTAEPPGQPQMAITWFDRGVSPALSLLQEDLQQFGTTRRQFPIAVGVTEEDLAAVRAVAVESSGRLHVEVGNDAVNEFQIDGPIATAPIIFEAASESCNAGIDGWPFDAEEVASTLAFNFSVLERLRINHLQRSNLLIIDSGVGTTLSETASFQPFLYINVQEYLYAETYEKDLTFSAASKICLDVDGSLASDAFGFAPDENESNCQVRTPLQRIAPVPKLGGERMPPYLPEHGSFVGALAIGGPDLVAAAPGLDRLVGLTFARVTRWPEAQTQSVKTEIADLKGALKFAVDRDVDVINASLRVSDRNVRNELTKMLDGFKGIVVAAAGNHPEELSDDSGSFPAGVIGPIRNDGHLIVVGAIQPDTNERWWPQSAWSNRFVDIAAPGVNLVSFDEQGDRVCMSGTSAAAPLVTFTAGVLNSLGVTSSSEIKRRILATADQESSIADMVVAGRILNINSALDLFVDLVWLEGEAHPRRAYLRRPDGDETKPVLLQLCKGDSTLLGRSSGWIDPGVLLFWQRGGEHAEVWHRLNVDVSEEGQMCDIPDGEITFQDLSSGAIEHVRLDQVRRLVPSPFRSAIKVAVEILDQE